MKISRKTFLLAATVLSLSACSSVGGLFEGDEETPLEGERVSVLDMQRSLRADAAQKLAITVPQAWINKAWPQAGGYPNHVLQNLAFALDDGVELSWKTSIGSGSSKEIPLNARPVVVGNAVFTMDTSSDVTAFDTETGKKVWQVNVRKDGEREDVISGGLSFGDDRLYVTNGYDEVLALSAHDGSILWIQRLPSPSRAAPTNIGGRLYVTTLDNRLMAFDAKTGASLWEYTGVGEAAGLVGAPSPAANNAVVVPAFSSGEITALRVENGALAWSDNLADLRQYGGGLDSLSDIKAMPIMHRGMIIGLSFSGKLAAINEATGARVWQKDISGSETPWVAGDFMYLIDSDNQVAAVSVADGGVQWVAPLPRYEDEEDNEGRIRWMGPVMASGKLLVAGSHGVVMVIDSASGQVVTEINTKQRLAFGPIISGGVLYLLGEGGTLMAYR